MNDAGIALGQQPCSQTAGGSLEVSRKPAPRDLLARLRKFRGRLPADFKFDRLEGNERD
jgi:antitoxin MazE